MIISYNPVTLGAGAKRVVVRNSQRGRPALGGWGPWPINPVAQSQASFDIPGFYDILQSVQNIALNIATGSITEDQARQIRQDAINSTLSQAGWTKGPNAPSPAKLEQIRQQLDIAIKKDQDALAAQSGGYALVPPTSSWLPWALAGGGLLLLWWVLK